MSFQVTIKKGTVSEMEAANKEQLLAWFQTQVTFLAPGDEIQITAVG